MQNYLELKVLGSVNKKFIKFHDEFSKEAFLRTKDENWFEFNKVIIPPSLGQVTFIKFEPVTSPQFTDRLIMKKLRFWTCFPLPHRALSHLKNYVA